MSDIYYYFCKTNLFDTVKDILKYFIDIKKSTGIQIDDNNYSEVIYNFIMYEIDSYYNIQLNRDILNKYVSIDFFHDTFIHKLPRYISYYKYFKLLKRVLILYHKSFNINFDINCPPVKDYSQTKDNKIYSLFYSNNMYIPFILNNKDKEFYPLVTGSYNIDNYPNESYNKKIIYIFNICSDVNEINLQLNTNYKTETLLKIMFEHFSKNTGYNIYSLYLENNNPWFSKAFSLYYKIGFVPLFDTVETFNISILDSMYGCDRLISDNVLYKNCKQEVNKKMLMIMTKNSNEKSILYYPDQITNNVVINRHEPFYDSIMAFAYRCSCFFDKFYKKNSPLCKKSMLLLNDYFSNKDNQNYEINETYDNVKYFNTINMYMNDINNPNSIIPDVYKKIVLDNQDLYRFLGIINGNLYNLNDVENLGNLNNNIKYLNPKYLVVVNKILINNIIHYNYAIYTKYSMNSTVGDLKYISNNNYIDINIMFNSIENELKNYIIVNNASEHILMTNISDNDKLIFIPCQYSYIDTFDRNNNILHVFSLVYNKYNSELYFYDSQAINSNRKLQDRFTFDFAIKFITLMLKFNNCNVNNIIDLTEYTFQNGKKIYNKIQSDIADDEKGSLCSLLSHVPYIVLNLTDTSKNISKQLKFYTWYIYFIAVMLKQRFKYTELIENLQSNIMIIFPYLYLSIYKIIKTYNDKQKQSLSGNKDIPFNNILIENQLKIIYDKLYNNIIKLNNRILTIIDDKDEIPYKYQKYYF